MDLATRTAAASGPGLVAMVGLIVPDTPVLIGLLSCFLVRLPLIRWRQWLPDVCLTGLALIGTGVTIHEHALKAGPAFWMGIGFGALGSTLIEFGKNFVSSDIKLRLQSALKILAGVKSDPPSGGPGGGS